MKILKRRFLPVFLIFTFFSRCLLIYQFNRFINFFYELNIYSKCPKYDISRLYIIYIVTAVTPHNVIYTEYPPVHGQQEINDGIKLFVFFAYFCLYTNNAYLITVYNKCIKIRSLSVFRDYKSSADRPRRDARTWRCYVYKYTTRGARRVAADETPRETISKVLTENKIEPRTRVKV